MQWGIWLLLILAPAPSAGEETGAKKVNKLLAGKLVYVAPMPRSLDRWILESLRVWGKYRVTGDPEGVDLIIQANPPEKQTEYEIREGVPHPRRERAERPAISISVINWVTHDTVWHAELLDRKQKKDEPEPPAGPGTKIFVRGLKPDEVALKITGKLREYVSDLEKGSR